MATGDSTYNYSKSDLLLLVGGQLAFLIIAIMVLLFGVGPIQFEYAEQMRNMVSKAPLASMVPLVSKSLLASNVQLPLNSK
jgi:hypothetical protein